MALDAYVKECAKNVAGNFNKVYITEAVNLTGVTGTTEITAVTMSGATKFHLYQAEIDSVQMKVEANSGQNYFTTQTLIMKFAKRSALLTTAIENLINNIPCGLCAIRVDGNGIAWLIGFDAAAVDKTSRPINKIKISYDSGSKPSDDGMNAVTVELSRESEYDEIPFNTALSTAIATTDTGTATFISIT